MHPRSGVPKLAARNATRPSISWHMDNDDRQSMSSRGHQTATMDTPSLVQLAGLEFQVVDRPVSAYQKDCRSLRASERQRALNTSKFDLVDGSSWHDNSTELLFTPSWDRVQSLQAGVSIRHPIRHISAPNLLRHGSTIPTDSADAEVDLGS